jgi:hypothetical protein
MLLVEPTLSTRPRDMLRTIVRSPRDVVSGTHQLHLSRRLNHRIALKTTASKIQLAIPPELGHWWEVEKVSGTVDMSVGVGLPQLLSWTAPRSHRRLQIEHSGYVFGPAFVAKGHPASDAPLQPLLLPVAESRCHLTRPIRVTTHRPRR